MVNRILGIIFPLSAFCPTIGVWLILNGKGVEPLNILVAGVGISLLGFLAIIDNWHKFSEKVPVILKVVSTSILLNMEAVVAVFVAKSQIIVAYGELGIAISALYSLVVVALVPLYIFILIKYWKKW